MILNRFKFQRKKENDIYERLIRFFILASVFLVPMFFLPITTEVIEINKVFLFYILVMAATIIWLLRVALKKSDKGFYFSPLGLFMVIFGVVFLASLLFSYHFETSLIGFSNYYHHSLISLMFFIIFFLLIINNLQGPEDVKKVGLIFLVSSVFVSIFSFFQVLKIHILPWALTKQASFNLVTNSITGFSVYLSLVIILILSFLIIYQKNWLKKLLIPYLIFTVFLMFVLDIKAGYLTLIIGLAIFLFFLTAKARRISLVWIIVSALILAFSIIFIFLPVKNIINLEVAEDLVLDQTTTLNVTKESLKNNFIFGSGPGTFYYDISRFRPINFNNSQYWQFSFIKSSGEWWQLLSSIGLVGFLGYAMIYIVYLISLLKAFYRKVAQDNGFFLLFLISSVSLIFLSGLYYTFSFTTSFIYFLLLGLGMIAIKGEVLKNRKPVVKRVNPFSNFGLSLIIIFSIVVLYFFGQVYLADYYFDKAGQGVNKQEDLAKVEKSLKKAVSLNPKRVNYHLALAQNYLVRVQLAATESSTQDIEQARSWLTQALESVQKGVDISKKDAQALISAAGIAQTLNLITGGLDGYISQLFTDAIAIESNNPDYYYGLANFQVFQAQQLLSATLEAEEDQKEILIEQAQGFYNLALANFQKASSLKENFQLSEVAIALTLEAKGEFAMALEEMKILVDKYPLDHSLIYELGRMNYNQNNLDEALLDFQTVVILFPEHVNAHWQLSLIYEEKGDKDTAIKEMEVVDSLSPGNDQVKQRLEELRKE